MRTQVEMFALWWDGKVLDLRYQNDDIALLVLSADIVSVNDDFLTNLITAVSSCSWFFDEQRHVEKVMEKIIRRIVYLP